MMRPRTSHRKSPSAKLHSAKLHLEQLEDRLAPATLAQSTFDAGDDGWRVGHFFDNDGAIVPTFVASDGNPGGFIRTTDAANIASFQAPAAFLGDKSAAYGGVLHVEERLLSSDGANYPIAALSDDNLFLQFRTPPPGTAWTPYDIPLVASAGWEIIDPANPTATGPLASEAQLQQVLSNLTLLNLFADWRTGADQVDIDNVRLESAPLPQSTFDTAADGWRIGEFFSSAGDSAPTFLATQGNPPGAIRTTDTFGVVAFQAPATFLGDQSAAYGGTLHLEQRLLAANGPHYPMVLLSDGTLFLQFRTPPPGTGWSVYDIPLIASAGWEVSNLSDTAEADPPASEEQLLQVLGNLSLFNVRADWNSGSDQVDLDNVRFESAPEVDLEVTIADAPDPALAGETLTYTITVTNHGPGDAANLTLATVVPANTTFLTFTPLAGGTTTTPAVGGGGAVASTIAQLAAGAAASFLFVVQVDSGEDAAIISASTTVSGAVNDLDLSNNTAAATTALYGTVRWNTDSDGLWTDPANWDAGFVPRPRDNAIIDRQGVEITVTIPQGDFSIAGLTSQEKLVIAGGGSLTLTKGSQLSALDIQVDADLVLDTGEPISEIAGDWNNAGRIAWIGSGSLHFTEGANLNNLAGGLFEIHTAEPAGAEPAGISFQGGGSLHNLAGGVIEVDPAEPAGISIAGLTNDGTIAVRSGTLNVKGGLSSGAFEVDAGAALNFAGAFALNPGANLTGAGSIRVDPAEPAGVVVVNGDVALQNLYVGRFGALHVAGAVTGTINVAGMLTGTGTIHGNVRNAGVVRPGNSPGILTIAGDYTQTAAGSLVLEVGGTRPGKNHDQLKITGRARLAGRLKVVFVSGYRPRPGDEFRVLRYRTRTGSLQFNKSGLQLSADGLLIKK